MNTKQLVLGGARSGKSQFAEHSIIQKASQGYSGSRATVHYIATAEALDDEMRARIQQHQLDRQQHENNLITPIQWELIEEPIELANTLSQFNANDFILIECLTLWLSNCMHYKNWTKQKDAFFQSLKQTSATIVMVSNEVGQGIVPMDKLSREFVDNAGWLHQELAQLCDNVSFITAGLAHQLK